MKPAISVEGISKEYLLGSEQMRYQSFREMLVGSLLAPVRKFKRLSGKDKKQERFWALNDVNFDIEPGEIVGIIGRNGAGKSTLLKILSRITTPTRGKITYRGQSASLLEVGTGFHPELTGRENIFLNGAILGMTKVQIAKHLDAIVDFAGLEKFLDTPVKRYSSGMYVRLAFSVAAHLETDILMVDEVLAVGDSMFQKKCLSKMNEISSMGKTVLFVSHNLASVSSLCSRGIVFEQGRVLADAGIDDAILCYLDSQSDDQNQTGSADFYFAADKSKAGDGGIRLKRVGFYVNNRESSTRSVISGESLVIEFEYDFFDKSKEEILNVAIAFQSQYGVAVRLDSILVDSYLSSESADCIVQCKIPKLTLGPGIYSFETGVSGRLGASQYFPDAGTIEVVEGDFYGTGKTVPNSQKSLFIEQEWSVA